MTIQAPESLIYGADTLKLSDYPLAPFLAQRQLQLKFRSVNSGCWRGYIGAWEIIGQQLYLVGLSGELANGESLGIGTLFTDNPQRVFAHWYSSTVCCPSGKILRNKHWGYLGTHEKDIFLTFEAGILVNERVVHNDASNTTDMGFDYCDMTDYIHPTINSGTDLA